MRACALFHGLILVILFNFRLLYFSINSDHGDKSVCDRHLRSKKHVSAVLELERDATRARNLCDMFEKQKVVSQKHLKFRFEVTRALIMAGMPLAALAITVVDPETGISTEYPSPLRLLLEQNNERLAGPREMANIVPLVKAAELQEVDKELERAQEKSPDGVLAFSLAADGTTHCAEAVNIVLRFMLDGRVVQRVIAIMMMRDPIDGPGLAALICEAVRRRGGRNPLSIEGLVALMMDRASVNTDAASRLTQTFKSRHMNAPCFSHTIDNAGKTFDVPLVQEFIGLWHTMSVSLKADGIFRSWFNRSWKGFSRTRWWSSWTQMAEDVFQNLPQIPLFLQDCIDQKVCVDTATALLRLAQQPAFHVELTGYVELGRPFVIGTYALEGDGFLAPYAYREVIRLLEMGAARPWSHPLVNALATELQNAQPPPAANPNLEQVVIQKCRDSVKPAIDYLKDRFENDEHLKRALHLFKFCQVFDPFTAITLTQHELQSALADCPLLSPYQRNQINDEIPIYLAMLATRGPKNLLDAAVGAAQHGEPHSPSQVCSVHLPRCFSV